jgi:hypothetical protein
MNARIASGRKKWRLNFMTYTELNESLSGRCKERRKLANNTYAERRGDGVIAIKLHKTDILTFRKDETIIVNTGGWRTVTTKDRINRYLPHGHAISQHRNVWYWIKVGDWDNRTPYDDGDQLVCVSGNYEVLTKTEKPDDKAQRALLKRIDKYAKLYGKALPLDNPNGGDCWGCHLRDEKGNEAMGTGHLISHMDEGYVVPSLAMAAMKERGAGPAWYWSVFKGDGKGSGFMLEPARKEIVRWVRRYMRRRLGLAS